MVESIFDYSPSEEELERLFRFKLHLGDERDKVNEEFLVFLKKSALTQKKTDYYLLYRLFNMRGDKKRAAECFAKMEQWQRDIFIQDF
jgi:hypothetical protein